MNEFDSKVSGSLSIARVTAILENYAPWERYVAAVKDRLPAHTSMGPSSLALMNQRNACDAEIGATRPKTHNDVSMMTLRSATVAQAAASSAASNPDERQRICPAVADDPFDDFDDDVKAPDDEREPTHGAFTTPKRSTKGAAEAQLTPCTPASNVRLGLISFPTIDDENVVIKALVDLLQALVPLGYEANAVRRSAEWSMRRAALFVKGDNGQLYEAQVDGVLLEKNGGQERTRVILEEKPSLRSDKYHTRYQEAAQVVAWIATEHSDDDPSWQADKDGTYR